MGIQLATPGSERHSRITVPVMMTAHTRMRLYHALVTISNDLEEITRM
jgi:hypothetical protein